MAKDDKPPMGKQFRGQAFVPIKTEDDVLEEQEAQVPFASPDAVPLATYFAVRGIRNPVDQAARKAYTKVRNATLDAWDTIFTDF